MDPHRTRPPAGPVRRLLAGRPGPWTPGWSRSGWTGGSWPRSTTGPPRWSTTSTASAASAPAAARSACAATPSAPSATRCCRSPAPVGSPEDGPYLLTSAHSPFYFNSEFRDLPSLRSKEPEPLLDMHPEAAAREGLADGDWAELATRTGRIRLRVRVTDKIAPDVVVAPAAWWYPERGADGGWREANVNLLTSNEDENPEMGSSTFRGLRCTVTRVP
ncbi:molybdopterin dinucleotide binding domain-containing protein [Kitasatospora aburaviensis]